MAKKFFQVPTLPQTKNIKEGILVRFYMYIFKSKYSILDDFMLPKPYYYKKRILSLNLGKGIGRPKQIFVPSAAPVKC